MIHIELPPADRPPSCPFVQRTIALTKILGRLEEGFALHRGEPYDVATGDLVFYTWPEKRVIPSGVVPIECGVGYDFAPWGPWRVYESEAWRHWHFGRYPQSPEQMRLSWVIPWAFSVDEWPLGEGRGGYVSYLGRLARDKGVRFIIELAQRMPKTAFKVASTDEGCGMWSDLPVNVEFVGPVLGLDRAKFLGGAAVHLCPTEYVEPLGGSAIEAQLCGTPVVASNYGGFTETIEPGVTGMLCRSIDQMQASLGQYLDEIARFQRPMIRERAVERFSLEAIAPRWRAALFEMRELCHYHGR